MKAYVKENILLPAGINRMRIGHSTPAFQQPGEAWYFPSREEKCPSILGANIQVPLPYGGFNVEAMDANGGWVASATDLLRFLLSVDGQDSRPDILAPATIQRMVTPSSALHCGYALGWWVNDQDDWCHTGFWPGSSALLERTVNGFAWVVLFNRHSGARTYFGALYRLAGKGDKEVALYAPSGKPASGKDLLPHRLSLFYPCFTARLHQANPVRV